MISFQPGRIYQLDEFGHSAVDNASHLINGAVQIISANGGGTLSIPTGTYRLHATASGSAINLYPGVSIFGNGSRLVLLDSCSFISGVSRVRASSLINGSILADSSRIPLAHPERFRPGDYVLVQLGYAAYDAYEPDYWFYGTISHVVKDAIFMQKPVKNVFKFGVNANRSDPQVMAFDSLLEDIDINDLDLDNNLGHYCESGIAFKYARRVRVSNISGRNTGTALVGGQYVEDFRASNLSLSKSVFTRDHPASGRFSCFAESRAVTLTDVYAEGFESQVMFAEARSDVVIERARIINNSPARLSKVPLFCTEGNSRITVKNVKVEGNSSVFHESGDDGSESTFFHVDLGSQLDPIIPNLSIFKGSLQIKYLERIREYSKKNVYAKEFLLAQSDRTDRTFSLVLPSGLFQKISIWVGNPTFVEACWLNGTRLKYGTIKKPGITFCGLGSGYSENIHESGSVISVIASKSLRGSTLLGLSVEYLS